MEGLSLRLSKSAFSDPHRSFLCACVISAPNDQSPFAIRNTSGTTNMPLSEHFFLNMAARRSNIPQQRVALVDYIRPTCPGRQALSVVGL